MERSSETRGLTRTQTGFFYTYMLFVLEKKERDHNASLRPARVNSQGLDKAFCRKKVIRLLTKLRFLTLPRIVSQARLMTCQGIRYVTRLSFDCAKVGPL